MFIRLAICFVTMVLSIMVGRYLAFNMLENVEKVSLSKDEWNRRLKQGNHFYIRQVIFVIVLSLVATVCFILFSIAPSRWWFFAGVLSGVVVGSQMTVLSKTRFLLYKNKLDINPSDDRAGDDDIL